MSNMILTLAVCIGLFLTACGGSGRPPAAAPAQVAPQPKTSADAGVPAADDTANAPNPADGPDLPTLRGRLQNALEFGQLALLALPGSWPSSDRSLVFYIYTIEPLPDGVAMERVEGPISVATIDVLTLAVKADSVAALPMVVKRQPPHDAGVKMRREAETLLLDVVAGRVTPDDAHDGLNQRYCKLLDDGALGRDLRKRAPEFVTWLSCDGFNDSQRLKIETAP